MIRHIITCEYPPQTGGVSDYTRTVAKGLAAAGYEVHVWCPQAGSSAPVDRVTVHPELGNFTPRDLRRVAQRLDQFPAPRRVLVQWVPHGYAYRSMNLWFCLWLWMRARRHRDEIELMVHEPYLSFGEGSWKQNLVACVHRLMTMVLLQAAHRVWVSTPAWESCWRPYALGRQIKFNWLPVGSSIPVTGNTKDTTLIHARYRGESESLIGHFGSYDVNTAGLLLNLVPELLNGTSTSLLLLGQHSLTMRAMLILERPSLADRIYATGTLPAEELSQHISACDLMLQPYIDGVSSRRTSTMVALAHGVPVVTTKGRLTEPLWAESKAVVLVPIEDISKFVERTQQLLPDAAARNGIRLAARKLYTTHFDDAQTIAKLRGFQSDFN